LSIPVLVTDAVVSYLRVTTQKWVAHSAIFCVINDVDLTEFSAKIDKQACQ